MRKGKGTMKVNVLILPTMHPQGSGVSLISITTGSLHTPPNTRSMLKRWQVEKLMHFKARLRETDSNSAELLSRTIILPGPPKKMLLILVTTAP